MTHQLSICFGATTKTIRTFILSALWVIVPVGAFGQALVSATGPGTYVSAGSSLSRSYSSYGQQIHSGYRVYVDTNALWRYGLECEASVLDYGHFGERQMTLTAGPRVVFGARRVIPYSRMLIGGGRFIFPYDYGRGDYLVLAPGAGIDYRITPKVRVRVVDVQYQKWMNFNFGDLRDFGLSSGISIDVFTSPQTKLSK